MKRGPEREDLKGLIIRLKKMGKEKPLWREVAELLSLPRRRKVVVNLGKIVKHVKEGEVALVPGKVLGDGLVERPLNVVAFEYSERALKKIKDNGGSAKRIEEFIGEKVDLSKVRLLR